MHFWKIFLSGTFLSQMVGEKQSKRCITKFKKKNCIPFLEEQYHKSSYKPRRRKNKRRGKNIYMESRDKSSTGFKNNIHLQTKLWMQKQMSERLKNVLQN